MNTYLTPESADFIVAPDGNDDAPGTLEQPFASLEKARLAAIHLKQTKAPRSILVLIRGGNYHIDKPLAFRAEDSMKEGTKIIYAAFPGEEPMLSSGIPINGWRKLPIEEEPSYICASASGQLWVADVPTAARNATAMFAGLRRLPRARGGGFTFWKDDAISQEECYHKGKVPPGMVQEWPDIKSAELITIPKSIWKMSILPIAGIDAKHGIVETAQKCTYPLLPNGRKNTAWVENTLAVLDTPGEWVLDKQNGRMYYWPETGVPETDIVLPVLSEFIHIGGQLDHEGNDDKPVQNIHFDGLTFAHNNRWPFEGRTGWGLQHDWEAFDKPTAVVRFRGAEGCTVRNCRFVAGDGAAIRLDLYAQNNAIENNVIENMGGAGVVLAGYGPGFKDVNKNNVVANNHIHHIGLSMWHAPAIFAWQSGSNRICKNHIHHTPYTGIVVSGRIRLRKSKDAECCNTIRWHEVEQLLGKDYEQGVWHDPEIWKNDWDKREPLLHGRKNLIEANDIHHVMLMLGDGNGIYVSGTGRDIVVSGNRVHDCPSPSFAEGIRCDDDQHEATVDGNIIYGLGGTATGITIKGVNTVTNNIIASPVSAKTGRGMISLEVGPLHGTVIKGNILYTTNKAHNFYFQGERVHGEGPLPLLRDCDADENTYWCTDDPEKPLRHLETERAHGIEMQSLAAEPSFCNPAKHDYRLKK